jgi:hypothetical protein
LADVMVVLLAAPRRQLGNLREGCPLRFQANEVDADVPDQQGAC